ncbi:hypothetical protein NP233_g1091 [Leucocoprinus birnbaumii]|uniref:Uncharacterized protein n=1 Tax=Leucocoprinus birnbaumii TaxID=56174 RepID=A0AAD5W1P4_9AGAR|nr:hypothetical protein NP233_g1091 [Leucocoprinus birnbaumii]
MLVNLGYIALSCYDRSGFTPGRTSLPGSTRLVVVDAHPGPWLLAAVAYFKAISSTSTLVKKQAKWCLLTHFGFKPPALHTVHGR